MVPTLEVGQRVLVDRVSFHFSDPEPGDIVVFHPPSGADNGTCGSMRESQLRGQARRDVAQETGAGDLSTTARKAALSDRIAELREDATLRGDGQVCTAPTAEKSDQNFIKRVVAGPGDELVVIDGRAVTNGKVLAAANGDATPSQACGNFSPDNSPEKADGNCNFPEPFTVPPDHYFMMGDNRGSSDDSRFWGPVPRDWIIGKAFATYWPPDRIGIF